jgi:hypothetical protein
MNEQLITGLSVPLSSTCSPFEFRILFPLTEKQRAPVTTINNENLWLYSLCTTNLQIEQKASTPALLCDSFPKGNGK